MSVDRELLFSTLFSRLQNITDFAYVSRLLKLYDDIEPYKQPSLMMVKGQETITQDKGMPPLWKLEGTIYVYCRNDADTAVSPSIQLNKLIQKVEEAFERKPGEGQSANAQVTNTNDFLTTLNGLCSHCSIAGTIVTDEGTLGNQAVAVIPFEIYVSA